jgi:E3 ubiquitin-protein ligase BOI-like protein
MAVQAQFAGCLPPYGGGGGGLADEQMRALLSAAAGNKAYQYNCAGGGVVSAAQSELTCNGGGGMALPSRKRGRDDEFAQYIAASWSAAALLPPIPGMQEASLVAHRSPSPAAIANLRGAVVDSAAASTSGRAATAGEASVSVSVADALVSELCRQGAEVDALVRGECDRLRAELERAHKRQRQALARAAAEGAARLLRAKDAELDAARRRAAELEEQLRQAAAETQAWCGVARSNEAVASGLRAALDTLLLHGGAGAAAAPAIQLAEEGFGDSADPCNFATAADDAESGCFVDAEDGRSGACAATSSFPAAASSRWACRACGAGEASVLLLPCRHLCLCKGCEPRADSCPVCLAAKNGAIHIATN